MSNLNKIRLIHSKPKYIQVLQGKSPALRAGLLPPSYVFHQLKFLQIDFDLHHFEILYGQNKNSYGKSRKVRAREGPDFCSLNVPHGKIPENLRLLPL